MPEEVLDFIEKGYDIWVSYDYIRYGMIIRVSKDNINSERLINFCELIWVTEAYNKFVFVNIIKSLVLEIDNFNKEAKTDTLK